MSCFIGYKFILTYVNSFYVDKGVQTEAWENYSNRTSQMASESITSIDTITPISENISPVSTLQNKLLLKLVLKLQLIV
jgi:hypothetical protein